MTAVDTSGWLPDEEIAATFRSHWTTLRAEHWAPFPDEADEAVARKVRGFARQHSPTDPWAEALHAYLRDVQLAWAAARHQPLLGPGTSVWRLAGAQFVRRMAGSYRLLDLPRATDGDWQAVLWVRLSDEAAVRVDQTARDLGCTRAQLLHAIIEQWCAGISMNISDVTTHG